MEVMMEERKNGERCSPIQWFQGLQPWVRGVILNGTVLIVLCLCFFMAGNYMFGPAKTARAYYEARIEGDWNKVYDCCIMPKSAFLSRQNFVNAMSYRPEGAEEKRETPQITSYMMRRKEKNGDKVTYQVNYSLKDDKEAHIETLIMECGSDVLGIFHNWYVSPEQLYVTAVKVIVPENARITVDGMDITEKYRQGKAEKGKAVYQIPYLFLGYHTVELKEQGKENYREIFEVTEKKTLEFIPEMQLNNKSGKEICDQAETALDAVCKAAAAHEKFSVVKEYFSSDSKTQKAAEEAYETLADEFSTKKKTGIATLSVTRVTTSVQNEEETMNAQIEMNYTAEKVSRWLLFFYKTKSYQDQTKMNVKVTKENDKWVFDEGLIPVL